MALSTCTFIIIVIIKLICYLGPTISVATKDVDNVVHIKAKHLKYTTFSKFSFSHRFTTHFSHHFITRVIHFVYIVHTTNYFANSQMFRDILVKESAGHKL